MIAEPAAIPGFHNPSSQGYGFRGSVAAGICERSLAVLPSVRKGKNMSESGSRPRGDRRAKSPAPWLNGAGSTRPISRP